ncbi:TPA: hypothetical protein MBE86_003453 [Klebsiella pneumoniae]|nr:hypothetical protein [Klebsiella pneumoniae]MCJ4738732.1 hypothetical protein [Klebsiella pneumoniae]MDV5377457.1 hypothetical protein [Klebsiella pneumoniae]MDV5421651.1 hypothetical protein [Klebsiella pneumoniae]MDV5473299.1 hypothetical protein [Klebsiella pneumoniae]MDV5696425.1 hypothetical protein [Klebsiella pneumoniae]
MIIFIICHLRRALPFFFTFAVMTYIHEGDKLSGLSIYIKYFAYFANNLFLHIVIRLFIFGFHHFEI